MFHQGLTNVSNRPGRRAKSAGVLPQGPAPILQPYVFEKLLGSGTYAKVYRVYDAGRNPAEKLAIKCIPRQNVKTKVAVNILTNEIEVLKKLKHPHIVGMLSFEWDTKYIFIVMEFCSNGDFSTLIQRNRGFVKEDDAKYYFRQLMDAICYLNAQNVAHLDLKPKNLLLTNKKQLKVADFGFSLILSATDSTDNAFALRGTPLYMAPEIVKNAARMHSESKPLKTCRVEKSIFDARSDLWSCGVILHEILYGRCPVDGSCSQEVLEKLMRLDHVIIAKNQQEKFSNECCDILTRLLKVLPRDRITFAELEVHPFLGLQLYRKRNEAKYKADESFSEGNKNVVAGNKAAAINAYATGAKFLMDLIQTESCMEERNRLRREVKRFTEKAEKLKAELGVAEKSDGAGISSTRVSRSASLSMTKSSDLNRPDNGLNFFTPSKQSYSYFAVVFKDHPEIVEKYKQTQPVPLKQFLDRYGFDECKNFLITAIDFYKDFMRNGHLLSEEEEKLIRSEIFRLLETAEKVTAGKRRPSLKLDIANSTSTKGGCFPQDESPVGGMNGKQPQFTDNLSPEEERQRAAGSAFGLKDDSIDPDAVATSNPNAGSHNSQCSIQ